MHRVRETLSLDFRKAIQKPLQSFTNTMQIDYAAFFITCWLVTLSLCSCTGAMEFKAARTSIQRK